MYPPSFIRTLILSVSFASNAFGQSDISDPTKRAEFALSALQIFYNAGTGLWSTTGWWNSANILNIVANLAKVDDSPQLQSLASRIFANTLVQAPPQNPQPGVEGNHNKQRVNSNDVFVMFNSTGVGSGYTKIMDNEDELVTTGERAKTAAANVNDWLDGFYDDDLWWALGWIAAYDVTQDKEYLTLAESIFAAVATTWGTNCGKGGIYWSWQKDYVNAIANELFLSTAAHLANRANDKASYVAWAKKEIDWFTTSGMINQRFTINDGLTSDCKNNNMTTWSYNQGVILGGLVELNRASPEDSYLTLAAKIAKAAIAELSDDSGILHDKCGPYCGADGSQFKGIFVRNLQLLHDVAPDDAYVEFIQTNANSVWTNNRDDGNMLSLDWAGPFINPANASTHSSAMEALIAAITVE
ncbi:glycoside hydrolase family 76 protein [Karstenula rhodostoma CBS 690.94]|uniref:Glycoside hydrolase family 76 protein n=1 Tax=Karstenula rhodostoma CBS 690.94 TaxID=1392251 RepID=A0A9P4PZS9_9PLEO|nr:glycoside hydrolase family 76 protein [Karstenula rhodostoma CBS 690.94]